MKTIAATIAMLLVGMVLVAMVLMAISLTANAASKTPRSRVGDTFQTFRDELPKVIGPNKRATLRLLPSSSRYEFHHDIWHTPGKAMIHKECAYDARNDPGKASCQTVWAHI